MKNLLVITAKSNLYKPVIEKIQEKIQPEDYLILTSENYKEVLAQARTRPMFSSQYVIEIHPLKMSQEVLAAIKRLMKGLDEEKPKEEMKMKKVDDKWVSYHPDDLIPLKWTPKVNFVFICSNLGEYNKMQQICEECKVEYVTLNCYRISFDIFSRYLKKNLRYHLDDQEVKTLMSRLRTRYDLTDTYIDKLNRLNYIPNKKALTKLVPNFNKISFERLWLYLILADPKQKKNIYQLYDDYRYGNEFFLKQLRLYSANTLALYREFYEGRLTSTTKNEWFNNQQKPDNTKYSPKDLAVVDYKLPHISTMYTLELYIQVFEKVSFDKLLFIDMILNEPIKGRTKLLETLMRIESSVF